MYCKKCGEKMTENADFCVHCGSKTGESNEDVSTKKPKKIIPIIIAVAIFGMASMIAFVFLNTNKTIVPKGLELGMSKEDVYTQYPSAKTKNGALEIVGDDKILGIDSNGAEMKYICIFDDYGGQKSIYLESVVIGQDTPNRSIIDYLTSLYGEYVSIIR